MVNFLIVVLVDAIALMIVAKLFKGIEVKGWGTLLVSAIIIGFVNAFIRPVIILLTLPINILTLGILTLFINGFLFYMVSKVVKGFNIKDYWTAFWGALVFSIVSVILNLLIVSQMLGATKSLEEWFEIRKINY